MQNTGVPVCFPFPSVWYLLGVRNLLEVRRQKAEGEKMKFEYYVLGAVAVVIVAAGVAMLPDLIRYMKIRAM
jgi:hypothetical protein